MIPYCDYRGIAVISYAPLLTGHLARPLGTETNRTKSLAGSPFEKKLRKSDKQIIRRVEEIANEKGWSMSQVALAWVAAKVTSPIVGVNKVRLGRASVGELIIDWPRVVQIERLHHNMITERVLTTDEIQYLEEL